MRRGNCTRRAVDVASNSRREARGRAKPRRSCRGAGARASPQPAVACEVSNDAGAAAGAAEGQRATNHTA